MAYPVDWETPYTAWVVDDGITTADFHRIEHNTSLLGDRLFGHIGNAGEWEEVANPNYYLTFTVAGGGSATGSYSYLHYMQIDKTIFLRGLLVLSVTGIVGRVNIFPYREIVPGYNYFEPVSRSVRYACGSGICYDNINFDASANFYTVQCQVMETAGPSDPIQVAMFTFTTYPATTCIQFNIMYEQYYLFTPTYGATSTSTSTTTIAPTTTSTTPLP